MHREDHRRLAENILATSELLGERDPEMRIEAAMLAGTHLLNLALHGHEIARDDADVIHTTMLSGNALRLYTLLEPELVGALARIEELRPLHVRGDAPGAQAAADEATRLLRSMAAHTLGERETGQLA